MRANKRPGLPPAARLLFIALFLLLPAVVQAATPLGLAEAISGLQSLTRPPRQAMPRQIPLDIDNNGKTGAEEVIFVLQVAAGLRAAPQATALQGIIVSGTMHDNQTTPAAIAHAFVEANADLNDNGAYESGEVFSTLTDSKGFFSIFIPAGRGAIPRMTLATRAAGYSEFHKTYTFVRESFREAITVAAGSFFEIDIAGIAAGPTRAGRVSLDTDQEINITLSRDRVTGRQSGRAGLGRFAAPPTGVDGEVLQVSFPLRALRLPPGSEKIYANVAYLDTANQPELMPGSFMAEAEGNTPKDVLKTYAASMIKVNDENGNELLNDPFDYSNQVSVKIAIPPETYGSIVDEVASSTDRIELPLYYFDEAQEIWKLHRDAQGAPIYGWLVDNFGNVLNSENLAQLQTNLFDDTGKITGTAYTPGGVASSQVVIYEVGQVNHFSTWNCDTAGRATSLNFKIKNKDKKPVNPPTRFRKIKGGASADRSNGGNKQGVQNLHTNYDAQADSIMKKLLGKDKTERERFLRWAIDNSDPRVVQALFEAMQRYIEDKRDEWGDTNELRNGLRAIFSSAMINDAIIAAAGNLDCAQTPDLCKGALAAAAEQVGKASNAKQAVAFLMQIAVDSYNPGNLNFDYVMDKGVGMMELCANSASSSGSMGSDFLGLVSDVKTLRDGVKALYTAGKPPSFSNPNWPAFRDKVNQLKDAMNQVKSAAEVAGRRLGRAALPRVAAQSAPPQTEAELAFVQQEVAWDYEDVGGMLLGAHKFSQWTWGYFQGDNFIQTPSPLGLAGGDEVGIWEYYNGSAWVPLPGRSDLGVDASHVPVPNVRSFGVGSVAAPAAFLGTWTVDLQPNVQITGRLVGKDDQPHLNAGKLPVYIGSSAFYANGQGVLSGLVSLYEESANITIPGALWTSKTVSNNRIALGDIKLPDQVIFNDQSSPAIITARNLRVDIDSGAVALSGAPIHYSYKLRSSYWRPEPMLETENDTGLFSLPTGLANIGTYYLDVIATADKDLGDGTKPTASKYITIEVRNNPPLINGITLPPGEIKVGDSFPVRLDDSDADSIPGEEPYDDIQSRYLSVICNDGSPWPVYVGAQQGLDSQGRISWTIKTDNDRLYPIKNSTIPCTVYAYIYDRAYGSASREQTFTLTQNPVAPVANNYWVTDSYCIAYTMELHPGYVQFADRNLDITSYELDCGLGGPPIVSSQPIGDLDPATPGWQGCLYEYDKPKVDGNGQTIPYLFSYKATDSGGRQASVSSQVTILGPLTMGVTFPPALTVTAPGAERPDNEGTNSTDFDIVELPSGDNRSFALGLTASSPNGNHGLASFNYAVRYQPANAYWWTTLASGNADQSNGTGTANVEISKPGRYYVFANAQDNSGMSATFSKIFYVSSDFDFRLTTNGKSAELAPPWFLTGQNITFASQMIAAPQGFSGSYTWSILYDGQSTFADVATASTLATTLPAGSHTIRLTMRNAADSQQPAVLKDTRVTVYAPLTLSLTSPYVPPVPADGAVSTGDTYTISINNPDGATLQKVYWTVWDVDTPGASLTDRYTVTNSEGLSSRSFVFFVPGNYRISLWAVDSRGLTASAESTIKVMDYPPLINALGIDTQLGAPPLTVNLNATASDANGTVVAYIWKVTGQLTGVNGQVTNLDQTFVRTAQNSTTPAAFSHTFSQLGQYRVALTVEDNSGRKSSSAHKDVTVLYRPPVINSMNAAPASGNAPLSTTITATASDIDGQVVNYAWDVDANGSLEQNGAQHTFTHTFTAAGTYEVRLTVTDSQGLIASRTQTIYVIPAGQQGLTFNFKELWGNGPGADYDFTANQQQGPHNDLGPPTMVRIGTTSPIEAPQYVESNGQLVITGNTMEAQQMMSGLPGYNGFYQNWNNPLIDLVNLKGGGVYTVGLTPAMSFSNPIPVTFPAEYVCGTIFKDDANDPHSFGITWQGQPQPPNPAGSTAMDLYSYNAEFMNKDGVLSVVALLGHEVANGKCVYSYSGHATQDVWPLADPQNPPGITLNSGAEINAKTLVLPSGVKFSRARLSLGNGTALHLPASHLQAFPNGNVPIPIVPGADYEFEFYIGADQWVARQFVFAKFTAAQIAGAATIEPDFTGLQNNAIVLNNMPTAVRQLEITYENEGLRAFSKVTGMSGAETVASNILTFSNATRVSYAALDSQYSGNLLQARRMGGGAFTGAIDFAALSPDVAVTNVTITVDSNLKNLELAYTSPAPVCLVTLSLDYAATENSQSRSREYHLFTDGAAGASKIQLRYPIPDLPDTWAPTTTVPGNAALSAASAKVQCLTTQVSYEELTRHLLENAKGQLNDPESGTLWGTTWWALDQANFGEATWSAP